MNLAVAVALISAGFWSLTLRRDVAAATSDVAYSVGTQWERSAPFEVRPRAFVMTRFGNVETLPSVPRGEA